MRCVALAQYLVEQGIEVSFLTAPSWPQIMEYLQRQNFDVRPLALDAAKLGASEDLEALVRNARGRTDWVVLDNYYFDLPFQEALQREGLHTLVLDDGEESRGLSADLVLNHGLQADASQYEAARARRCLLGTEYALIRTELRSYRRKPRARSNHLLITLGAGARERSGPK